MWMKGEAILQVVITMAGMGTRFREAGYLQPKYQIEVCGKTLFQWSLGSLKDFFSEKFFFIVRSADQAMEFIQSECEKFGIHTYKIIEIPELTDGQASTVLAAASDWEADDALLVYNIDTYVEPGQILKSSFRGDGFIPCFIGEGDHWSFVKLNEKSEAAEVREKCRISEYCTLGAYYFRSCKLYENLYQEYYSSTAHLENGEKYIAPLYNALIEQGGKVYISVVDVEKVHVLGTPKEVENFKYFNP